MVKKTNQGFKERLNQAWENRDKTKIKSKKHLAELANVKYNTIMRWFRGEDISKENAILLAELLTVDFMLLFTGENITQIREFETDYKTARDIMIPVYDVELSAGDGMAAPEFVETDRKLPFDSQWLTKNNLQVNECAVLKVKGDSMEPTLEDGDSVLIDRSKTDIIDRKIYAIVLGEDLKIKRVVRKYDGALEIISDNPVHSNEVIPVEDVDHVIIIGRAVYRSGNL